MPDATPALETATDEGVIASDVQPPSPHMHTGCWLLALLVGDTANLEVDQGFVPDFATAALATLVALLLGALGIWLAVTLLTSPGGAAPTH